MKEQTLQEKIRSAYDSGNIAALRDLRLELMADTIRISLMRWYEVSGRDVTLPDQREMISGSILYADPGEVRIPANEKPTLVSVVKSDTLLAGKALLDEGYNPAVLNFANRNTPGGGVLHGAGAQEENIFRRTNLFQSLYQFHCHGERLCIQQRPEQYPLDRNTGGVYSPDVTVFRGLELDGYPLLEEPYQLGVVTVAALNRPPLKDADHLADEMTEPTRRKMRTIFRIALKHGHDSIVLGAWGCGAFKNPPKHIARLFHEVMLEDEFRNRFRKIVFAIVDREHIEKTDGKGGNFEPFRAEFSSEAGPENKTENGGGRADMLRRFRGMFWGLVVGDCLGSPIQFSDKDRHVHVTDMIPCAYFHTPPGYWTDDSSMAFCVADSVARCGKYDLQDIADTFLRWFRDGYWSSLPEAFDVGGATAFAMHGIRSGKLCNGSEDSQGNGSIMRLAPSYILNYGNPDRTRLHEVSDLTHCSRRVRGVVDLMADVCDEHMQGRRTVVQSAYETRDEVNNSGWAVSTLQAALWAFHTTETFEDGMIAAVNLGGDADTIGAVYGQIAGAFYGFDAIPERWLSAIKDRGKIDDLIERFLSLCVKS